MVAVKGGRLKTKKSTFPSRGKPVRLRFHLSFETSGCHLKTQKLEPLKTRRCFLTFSTFVLLQMSLFTFFSAVCVVLQMIGTILTGDAGGLLKSLVMCEKQISGQTCKCCDSIAACRHSAGGIVFEGVSDCSSLTGLLTGLMYGLCVLTIFGSLLCFVATILGCTAVARETSRNQVIIFNNNNNNNNNNKVMIIVVSA